MNDEYGLVLRGHYEASWSSHYVERRWALDAPRALPSAFCVLEFPPFASRQMWTYATCCMSRPEDKSKTEVHLFAPERNRQHVELLTALAHYHRTAAQLRLGDTVSFGRPWLPGGTCDCGLVSLPYLDGPKLEWLELPCSDSVRFLWLIPITPDERAFKMRHGVEELEARFEEAAVNYLDPRRPSVVAL